MNTTNDQHYIHKVLQGDVNAFASLVDAYKNMVFMLAYKMTKNREEAEEVSQDTFMKAFKSIEKFKGDSKFSTWLYRIAYHTCLDAIKKNRNHHNSIEINEITYHQIHATENIIESIERKERAKIMDACLLKLPEDERSILWMFYYEELSLKEIISITDISEANLKVKLHRGRKKLLKIVHETVEPEIIENYGRR